MAELKAKAAQLLRSIVQEYEDTKSFGSFSCTVYDTAWVSMVTKVVDGKQIWLFPSSFQYVLNSQQPDGSWVKYGSEIDGIMNTAAGLLALCRHRSTHHQLDDRIPLDLDLRVIRAEAALRQRLEAWEVEATLHVGFEVLVPAMLSLLEEVGFAFDFPGRQHLLNSHDQKMARFHPSMLYHKQQYPALHSLEAFVGKVDFNRLKHHTRFGSMLASPSSTAAYLIYGTHWDIESESYLRRVISNGEGKGCGGVPSAFPSTNFDLIWTVSTLLQGGFTREELGSDQVEVACEVLESSFESGGGLLGFAPQLAPDADDTSKAITILRRLGKPAFVEPMIKEYYTSSHFRTYPFERNPSFTVNCNVLTSLLSTDLQIEKYAQEIESVVRFLCNSWWSTDGLIIDKWNLSPHYPAMLLSESSMTFLRSWDQGKLPTSKSNTLLVQKLLITLFQVLVCTLQAQNEDGSWGCKQGEPSAYAILTLVSLASLPVAVAIKPHILAAIERGRLFLSDLPSSIQPDYIWIEKVTYRSKNFHQAYVLAALNAPLTDQDFKGKISQVIHLPWERIVKLEKLSKRLPIFASSPDWTIKASLIEGYLFLPQLNSIRLDVFPRKNMAEDKYFEYIPFAWTSTNNLKRAHLRGTFLREMMIISFLNYQADEYMETSVSTCFADRLDDARDLINRLFDELRSRANGQNKNLLDGNTSEDSSAPEVENGESSSDKGRASMKRKRGPDEPVATDKIDSTIDESSVEQESEVRETLRRFVGHVLDHPTVQTASRYDKGRLRHELRTFLLAHVDQIEDNRRLSGNLAPSEAISRTFFDWVRSTGSDHTSCPYSFAFAVCLLGEGDDFFSSGNEKYFAQVTCRHLATLCRMYNDIGSVARDRLEENLNSLDFPEFHTARTIPLQNNVLKDQIYQLATFERKCLELALGDLRATSRELTLRFVNTFIDVTDMFGQIYVEKDIASRMK